MSKNSMQRAAFIRSWGGVVGSGLLLVVVFILAWYHYLCRPGSFSSDHLYCLHFCDDLVHGRDLRGWHLPAAPYLFPDMVILSGLTLLTSDTATVFLLYSVIQYLVMFAVLWWIFRLMNFSRREAFTTSALGVTLLLAACFHPDYEIRSLLLLNPGNHMACHLVGLAATALVLHGLVKGYRWVSAVFLVVVCSLCAFSDHLLIAQFLVPISASVLLLALVRLTTMRRALLTTGLLGLAVLLAMTKQRVLTRLGFVPMRLTLSYQWPGLNAFKEFASIFWESFCDQWMMLVVILLHFLFALSAIAFGIRRIRQKQSSAENADATDINVHPNSPAILFIVLILLLAPLCNAAALMIAKMVNISTLYRYLYTWLQLPFLFIAMWPRLYPWQPLRRLVPVSILAVVFFRLITFPDPLPIDHFDARYPPLARALDEMVRKHGRLRGFAEYWRAREMHYLTHERVEVLPILSWGLPWFHGTNPNSFLTDDRRDLTIPDYQFVIVPTSGEQGPDPEHIQSRYGKPAEIIAVLGYEIWRYERLANRQLDLFLRAQLAQRFAEQRPFVGPREPSLLAVSKRNLTAWESRKNVLLPREDTLVVRFDKPARGAMIDIAANFADEYILWFYRAGRKLCKTRVPSVDWTGAEIAYCEPGLQSRLVAVPPACREDGFDEVRITPLGRSPHFSIGHFLVFDEWIPYSSGWVRPGDNYHHHEGEKMSRPDSSEVKTIADPSASAGQARQASAGFQGCMAFGPYLPLPPGRYRVDFALKIDDNTSTDTVATLDAYAFAGQQRLQIRPLSGRDFASANQYQIFSFTFDAEDELDLVEYRVLVPGKTKVTLDYVDVTRLTADKTSEACEP
jgi:hypothetical protein